MKKDTREDMLMVMKNDEDVSVYYDGKVVFNWNDDACCDSPEDLIWSRDISHVFYEAFRLGLRVADDLKRSEDA